MKTVIVGAGLSGLLAANILRKRNVVIYEKQKSLPNNHNALLRFRTNAVGVACGIPFKKVKVQKQLSSTTASGIVPIDLSNQYSIKVIGEISNRSIMDLSNCERYIAPQDLVSQMALGIDIRYNQDIDKKFILGAEGNIISTMPMYNLMKILGWKEIPNFKTRPIYTITADIIHPEVEVYQTTYYPDESKKIYRSSITGNKIIVELIEELGPRYKEEYLKEILCNDYGIYIADIKNIIYKEQKHGKLVEDKTGICKQFIGWATRQHGIYSIGRWALHRQILMDDVIKDIMFVQNMIESDYYGVKK